MDKITVEVREEEVRSWVADFGPPPRLEKNGRAIALKENHPETHRQNQEGEEDENDFLPMGLQTNS